MGIFSFLKEEQNQIDYERIGEIISGVAERLEEYAKDVPEVVIDPDKKSLAPEGEVDNSTKMALGIYYCSILEWYSSNRRASNGIMNYCDEHFPMIDRKTVENLAGKIPGKNAEYYLHVTKIAMGAGIDVAVKWMNEASRNIPTVKMPEAFGEVFINEKLNQKCTDFNKTLLSESLNQILEICKGKK